MATAKQQTTTQYGVSLLIEGSKLETVAKKIKAAVGDVKVLSVEKITVPGSGEWGTEWVDDRLRNTDGRVIWRQTDCTEFYDKAEPTESSQYTYYTVRDGYGKECRSADGKWNIESLEEAKAAVRKQMTAAEIQNAADDIARWIAKVGAGAKDEDAAIEKLAESYLMGRGLEIPEQENEEEEGNRVGELLSDMEERRDNTPENFQGGETYETVESAVDLLEQLK